MTKCTLPDNASLLNTDGMTAWGCGSDGRRALGCWLWIRCTMVFSMTRRREEAGSRTQDENDRGSVHMREL